MKLKLEIETELSTAEVVTHLLKLPYVSLHIYGKQHDAQITKAKVSLAEQYKAERKAQAKTKPRKRWPELVYQGEDYNARVDIEATLAKNSWTEDEIMRNIQTKDTAKMALKNALRMRNRLKFQKQVQEPAV